MARIIRGLILPPRRPSILDLAIYWRLAILPILPVTLCAFQLHKRQAKARACKAHAQAQDGSGVTGAEASSIQAESERQ